MLSPKEPGWVDPYTLRAGVCVCDLFTLVLSWLDVCVLPLVSIEPRLHAEVWLPAPLVQLVPWLVSRQTVTQYSLKHTSGEWVRKAADVE